MNGKNADAEKVGCRWEHFSRGADIGVRGFGPTPANAFEQAALAMSGAVVDLPKVGIEKADRCEIRVNFQTK